MVINDYVNLEWVKKYSNPVAAMKHCVDKLLEVFFVLFCFVLFCFVFFTHFIDELKSVICHRTGHWLVQNIGSDWPEWEEKYLNCATPIEAKKYRKKNRMEKTRDLLKKIRDTKQTFHAKMGSIKDRSGLGLKEAEDFKKRWQKYTDKIVQKRYSWPR